MDFLDKDAHSEFSKHCVDLIIQLNIKLNGIYSVQVAFSLLVISIDIWNGALSRQNFGHVVILDIA
jgi:hypothetical protein